MVTYWQWNWKLLWSCGLWCSGGNSSKTLENRRRYLVMLGEPQCWSHNVKALECSSLPGSCHFPFFLCIFPKLHSPMAASVHLNPKRYIKTLLFRPNPNWYSTCRKIIKNKWRKNRLWNKLWFNYELFN